MTENNQTFFVTRVKRRVREFITASQGYQNNETAHVHLVFNKLRDLEQMESNGCSNKEAPESANQLSSDLAP